MQISVGKAGGEDGQLAKSTNSMANRQAVQEGHWSASTMEVHKAAAATKIQAAVRGFNVRRRKPLTHLRIIASVKKELGELQMKTADGTYIERICVDVMECRKLQEGIMALLLQLDGLQDVHPVVRDIRKSVNREVVQFMEVIDAVVVGAPSSPWLDGKNNPNMGRSNSISHIDRVSSNTLKRMLSLDNCTNPEQSYKRQHDEGLNFARNGADGDVMAHSVRRDRSPLGSPTNAAGGSAMEHSGPEEMDYHSELEALRTLTAVVTIQSCLRGYRVRRSCPLMHLRNIADVRGRLRELSDQVSNPSIQSKLRFDEMERLKVTECITALLLRLDSVQGVDQVVRDIRKSVTKEVFMLAETVDSLISNIEIVEGDLTPVGDDTESESDESLLDCQQGPVDNWRADVCKPVADSVTLDSLSLYGTDRQGVDDNQVGPPTPEFDQQRKYRDLDDVSSGPSTEDSCPERELGDLQVRMLDGSIPIVTNFPSSESEAEPVAPILSDSSDSDLHESRRSDRESEPCAAVDFHEDYSSSANEEISGPLPALKVFPTWEDLQAQALAMSSGPFHGNVSLRNTYDTADIESPEDFQSSGGEMSPNAHATSGKKMESHHDHAAASLSPTPIQFDNCVPRPADIPFLGENVVRATGDRDGHIMRTPGAGSNAGNFNASDILMNEAMFVRNQQQQVGCMDGMGHLAEENARLRAFLNQVLNFIEVQSSMVSNVTETNEKLEAENERLKKREEVWRKKSKRARRRG